MAHAWKACWVHALAGSNPASSAAAHPPPLVSRDSNQESALTSNRRHSPGMPLSGRDPRSANRMDEPTTRSFTVPETNTRPLPASAMTRAAMCTAMPAI